MGSESPTRACVIHVTGFKKFHGVDENPTEAVATTLQDYLEKKGLPPGSRLGSVTVLETAGEGALSDLTTLLNSAISTNPVGKNEEIVWLHMGVNRGASKFVLETRAINEATFRCPDEFGWQPQGTPIVVDDGDISHVRETTVPVVQLVDVLIKRGHDVVISDDAGRFVCNYVYYHSLRHASLHGTRSLFLHVPPFGKLDLKKQLEFVALVLEILVLIC